MTDVRVDEEGRTCAGQNDVENAGDDGQRQRHRRNGAVQGSVLLLRPDDRLLLLLVSGTDRLAGAGHRRLAYLHADVRLARPSAAPGCLRRPFVAVTGHVIAEKY